MDRTLSSAREAFVAAATRDTPGTDLPRYVAVLDALIAWSLARPAVLEFRVSEGRTDVVSFARTGSNAVSWSVQVTRGVGPKGHPDWSGTRRAAGRQLLHLGPCFPDRARHRRRVRLCRCAA